MRSRRDDEFLARDGEAVHFLAAEVEDRLEILQRPKAMGQLPAPIIPLLGGCVEGLPSDETRRNCDCAGLYGRLFFEYRYGLGARCARRFRDFLRHGRLFRAVGFPA
jgi:hypothetical protein